MITETNVKAVLAERIRQKRVSTGVSQRGLSSECGLGDNALYRIENENYRWGLSLSTVIQIANALDLSLNELFEGL